MSAADEREIAMRFVSARRFARALTEYPGRMPETLAAAYRIQDHAIAAMNAPVAGWKVGKIGPPAAARYGADRLVGPVFAPALQHASAGSIRSGFVYSGGYAAAEAELLFRLRSAPEADKVRLTADEVAALVKSVHVGIEIASSPFPRINDHGPAVTVSDFGNNNGLIIGPEIPDWAASRTEWTVVTKIDDRVVGTARAGDLPRGPIAAIQFLLEHLAVRGIPLQPGAWISSGAITGVHTVQAGERVTAVFMHDLMVECLIEHAAPQC